METYNSIRKIGSKIAFSPVSEMMEKLRSMRPFKMATWRHVLEDYDAELKLESGLTTSAVQLDESGVDREAEITNPAYTFIAFRMDYLREGAEQMMKRLYKQLNSYPDIERLRYEKFSYENEPDYYAFFFRQTEHSER